MSAVQTAPAAHNHGQAVASASGNGRTSISAQKLQALAPAERAQALAKASNEELQQLAREAKSLSHDQKRDLFNALADGASGKDLARVASAFDSPADTQLMAESIASKASNSSKQDYIQAMSSRTAGSDKDAKAIATVRESLETQKSESSSSLRSLPQTPSAAARQSATAAPVPDAAEQPAQTASGPQTCTYKQSSGNLRCVNPQGEETVNHNGYAGRNVKNGTQGRNNPDAQADRNIGPIPRGSYTVGAARNSKQTGPAVRDLTPDQGNQMEGRSAFQVHGDNAAGDASDGCVIMPRDVRNKLHQGDRLEVKR